MKFLIDNGYAPRILLSHDLHTKHRLVSWLELLLYKYRMCYCIALFLGPLWWSWLCSHSGEYCTQNGRQRHQQRHGHGDTHNQPKELAHLQIELESRRTVGACIHTCTCIFEHYTMQKQSYKSQNVTRGSS